MLVELHGGRLTLASEPGRGTEVTVSFPPERMLPAPGAALPEARRAAR
jgi:signal transduction histidine kinase